MFWVRGSLLLFSITADRLASREAELVSEALDDIRDLATMGKDKVDMLLVSACRQEENHGHTS